MNSKEMWETSKQSCFKTSLCSVAVWEDAPSWDACRIISTGLFDLAPPPHQ